MDDHEFSVPRFEHNGNSVYAIVTQDGVAVYPTLDDAVAAFVADSVQETDADFDYYQALDWNHIPFATVAETFPELAEKV